MKKISFIIVVILVYFGNLLSSDLLLPVIKNGRWGYIDESKQILIPYQFFKATYFYEDYAGVTVGPGHNGQEEWHFIDKSGNFLKIKKIIDKEGKEINKFENYKNKLVTSVENKFNEGYIPSWGSFVDTNGNLIIPPKIIKGTSGFYQGLAPALIKKKWGFINKKWDCVIEPKFSEVSHMIDGMALVEVNNEKHGYLNKSGTFFDFSEYENHEMPSEGVAFMFKWVKNSKFPYSHSVAYCVNTEGRVIFSVECEEIGKFSEGLAGIKIKDHGWGFINKKGKLAIKPQFSHIGFFSEGLSAAYTSDKIGYISESGNFEIEIVTPYAKDAVLLNPFKNGLAQILICVEGGISWYIDKKGNYFWKSKIM